MAVSGEIKRHPNKLGVGGWVYGGRYGSSRVFYILHRISGLGILLYLILHIFVTATRLKGSVAWENLMTTLKHPLFRFGEFLLFIAFAFHALNGIRLIITELGYSLGRPAPPRYPYELSLSRQRLLSWVLMVIAGILIVLGFLDFYIFKI